MAWDFETEPEYSGAAKAQFAHLVDLEVGNL